MKKKTKKSTKEILKLTRNIAISWILSWFVLFKGVQLIEKLTPSPPGHAMSLTEMWVIYLVSATLLTIPIIKDNYKK
jgi:hypothetical protein